MNGMTATAFFEKAMILAIEASRFYHSLPPSVFVEAQQWQATQAYQPYFMCLLKALNHRVLWFAEHILKVLGFDDTSAQVARYLHSKGAEPTPSNLLDTTRDGE